MSSNKKPLTVKINNKNEIIPNKYREYRTLSKHLDSLIQNNLIEINIDGTNIIKTSTIKSNDMFYIKVNEIGVNSFLAMPDEITIKHQLQLGTTGWSIFCLLSNLHNNNYGGIQSTGFANPKQKYISDILNTNRSTVQKYLKLLEEQKLIKIVKQLPEEYELENGEIQYKQLSDHYIVIWRTLEKYNTNIK